jgi:hypothetical protein
MSMRIQNDGLSGTTASPVIPAESTEQSGSSGRSSSVSSGSVDRVDISSLLGNLSASAGALADKQAARVSQLTAIYGRGEYSADSAQTSRALISGAIAGGYFGGDN